MAAIYAHQTGRDVPRYLTELHAQAPVHAEPRVAPSALTAAETGAAVATAVASARVPRRPFKPRSECTPDEVAKRKRNVQASLASRARKRD
eukprot:2101574-Prymnesium_polylepis.1